ncbi:MAG: 50S ribosomal protein L6 [Fibrobacterota bacterium]
MSRVGKLPVAIEKDVKASLQGSNLKVEGPKGSLELDVMPGIEVSIEESEIIAKRNSDTPRDRAFHGMTRALIANMVKGVTAGFEKKLELQGVGFRVEKKGKDLVFQIGFSHPVIYKAWDGIDFEVERNLIITVRGIDKSKVGQVAAEIRSIKPPEPYKGKGIRYVGERIIRKAGKAGAK